MKREGFVQCAQSCAAKREGFVPRAQSCAVRRGGFVLMAALWLLIALSAVGLDAAMRHRGRRLAAANLLDQTRLQAAAAAGTEYARSRLTSAMLGRADQLRAEAARVNQPGVTQRGPRDNSMTRMFRISDPAADPWRDPSGLMPSQIEWNGITIALTLRDPNAALNINAGSGQMFEQFFSQGLHLDYALANRLAAAILDWRDDDDIPQVNGGERDEYIHDGAAMLPSNHAFGSVDELRFVRGMTDEIFQAARPFLSVRRNGSVINVNAAPEQVLLAIPGMDPAGVTVLMRQRRAGVFPRTATELRAMLPSSTVAAMTASSRGAFGSGITYTTDQVEVIGSTSVPGSPVRAVSDIIVDRAVNGATVTWRRIQ